MVSTAFRSETSDEEIYYGITYTFSISGALIIAHRGQLQEKYFLYFSQDFRL